MRRPGKIKDGKRVLIVDDHPVMRRGISCMIESVPDLIPFDGLDGSTPIADIIAKINPHIIIIDMSLGERNGIELIKDAKLLRPDIAILAYSVHSESVYAERVLKAGGQGYMEKSAHPEELVKAVRHVLDGNIWLSEKMKSKILKRTNGDDSIEIGEMDVLSNRELHVFELEGRGFSTVEIAGFLNLSPKTIESYKKQIKDKLGIRNHVELRYRAIEWVMNDV